MQEAKIATVSPDINARIGMQVRALRVDCGMTLEALAAASHVSRSMISVVERGKSSATAAVLEKIAAGLGLPLASLFNDPISAPAPVSRRADRPTWRDPLSGYIRRNVSPANFPSPIQIVEVQLPGRARVAYETGVREVRIHQQIWVRKGRLDVSVGNVTYRLAEDDCLAMKLDEPIVFRNPLSRTAHYLVVVVAERWLGIKT
jgi:transcriptional regulator with XRE-family HTH domain